MKSSLFREVRYDREIVYEDDEACTVIVYEPLRFEHGDVAGVRTEDVDAGFPASAPRAGGRIRGRRG